MPISGYLLFSAAGFAFLGMLICFGGIEFGWDAEGRHPANVIYWFAIAGMSFSLLAAVIFIV